MRRETQLRMASSVCSSPTTIESSVWPIRFWALKQPALIKVYSFSAKPSLISSFVFVGRKMNKHVNKLNKEANDARKMIDDSDSDSDNDSDSEKKNGANQVNPGEKPTEEQVERLEEKLEAAQADQKNLFLIIFQVRNKELKCCRELFNLRLEWKSRCC